MSSNSKMSIHPPRLPVELQLAVLRWCPPPTLACTCQVSFAWLELASPLLYSNIELTSQNQLARMFCSRPRSSSPDLERYLDLSQIHSLTLTQRLNLEEDFPPVSLDRIPPTSRLRLDRLTLRIEWDAHWDTCRPILQLLDPIHLTIKGTVFNTFYMDEIAWENVRTVELVDAAVYPPFGGVRTGGIEVVCRFTSEEHPFFFERWVRALVKEAGAGRESGGDGLKTLDVWVRTERQREEVVNKLKNKDGPDGERSWVTVVIKS